MPASSEPSVLASQSLLAVKGLMLNDFLHEIGHSVGLLGMMTFNLAGGAGAGPVEPSRLRADRMAGAVEALARACEMMRTLGVPLRTATLPQEQWHASARRMDVVTGLARARSGVELLVRPGECPVKWNPLLAQLEAITICVIKELADSLPAGTGGTIEICLHHDRPEDPDLAPALSISLAGCHCDLGTAIPATARWVAAAFACNIMWEAPGAVLRVGRV